jgi:hypothetical protein
MKVRYAGPAPVLDPENAPLARAILAMLHRENATAKTPCPLEKLFAVGAESGRLFECVGQLIQTKSIQNGQFLSPRKGDTRPWTGFWPTGQIAAQTPYYTSLPSKRHCQSVMAHPTYPEWKKALAALVLAEWAQGQTHAEALCQRLECSVTTLKSLLTPKSEAGRAFQKRLLSLAAQLNQ